MEKDERGSMQMVIRKLAIIRDICDLRSVFSAVAT
jgi:hypothetical protein